MNIDGIEFTLTVKGTFNQWRCVREIDLDLLKLARDPLFVIGEEIVLIAEEIESFLSNEDPSV